VVINVLLQEKGFGD